MADVLAFALASWGNFLGTCFLMFWAAACLNVALLGIIRPRSG